MAIATPTQSPLTVINHAYEVINNWDAYMKRENTRILALIRLRDVTQLADEKGVLEDPWG